jgi:hypothetical protein
MNARRKIATGFASRSECGIAFLIDKELTEGLSQNELRYPSDLPKLNRRQANFRRPNIAMSHFERNRRGELAEIDGERGGPVR